MWYNHHCVWCIELKLLKRPQFISISHSLCVCANIRCYCQKVSYLQVNDEHQKEVHCKKKTGFLQVTLHEYHLSADDSQCSLCFSVSIFFFPLLNFSNLCRVIFFIPNTFKLKNVFSLSDKLMLLLLLLL